jgi:hypothetical protein
MLNRSEKLPTMEELDEATGALIDAFNAVEATGMPARQLFQHYGDETLDQIPEHLNVRDLEQLLTRTVAWEEDVERIRYEIRTVRAATLRLWYQVDARDRSPRRAAA